VLELAMGALLAVEFGAGLSEILEEVADLLGHWDYCFASTGLLIFGGMEPRALPWPEVFCPFGAVDDG
jgi:hypothetical protein